jgi:hypothetical protein
VILCHVSGSFPTRHLILTYFKDATRISSHPIPRLKETWDHDDDDEEDTGDVDHRRDPSAMEVEKVI